MFLASTLLACSLCVLVVQRHEAINQSAVVNPVASDYFYLPPPIRKMFVFAAKLQNDQDAKAAKTYADTARTIALFFGFLALVRAAPHVIVALRRSGGGGGGAGAPS